MTCKNCGENNLNKNYNFCFSCGNKLEQILFDSNEKAKLSWTDFLIDKTKEYTILELAETRLQIAFWGLILLLGLGSIYSIYLFYQYNIYELLATYIVLISVLIIFYRIKSAICISLFSGLMFLSYIFYGMYSGIFLIKMFFIVIFTIQSFKASIIIKTKSKKTVIIMIGIIVIFLAFSIFGALKQEELMPWEMNLKAVE